MSIDMPEHPIEGPMQREIDSLREKVEVLKNSNSSLRNRLGNRSEVVKRLDITKIRRLTAERDEAKVIVGRYEAYADLLKTQGKSDREEILRDWQKLLHERNAAQARTRAAAGLLDDALHRRVSWEEEIQAFLAAHPELLEKP